MSGVGFFSSSVIFAQVFVGARGRARGLGVWDAMEHRELYSKGCGKSGGQWSEEWWKQILERVFMTSMEDEQWEASSESRVSWLETHAATRERSDESVTKVVCLHFGPERV